MQGVIFGDGPMGRALARAIDERGDRVHLLGRPGSGARRTAELKGADAVFDASVGPAVRDNLAEALEAGCRSIVVATTGWDGDRNAIDEAMRTAGACGVWAPNFSLGTALFGRLVDRAAVLYGRTEAFDPFIVEWHRRAKRDRPSGTARDLAARLAKWSGADEEIEVASIRAGSSPGMHLVGFDAPGETVELRITARDRSAYAAGALAAADWMMRQPRTPGLHTFNRVVDDLVADPVHPAGDEDLPAAIGHTQGNAS